VTDIHELRDRVLGHRFPGAKFRVEEYERFLGADAMLSPSSGPGLLHPVWIFMAGFRSLGLSLDGLAHLIGASATDGVMLGETRIEQFQVLHSATDYWIRGEIVRIERHVGNRIGPFDVLTCRVEIVGERGELHASVTNAFIFPRRSDATL
jgi:hypothetical protein